MPIKNQKIIIFFTPQTPFLDPSGTSKVLEMLPKALYL